MEVVVMDTKGELYVLWANGNCAPTGKHLLIALKKFCKKYNVIFVGML